MGETPAETRREVDAQRARGRAHRGPARATASTCGKAARTRLLFGGSAPAASSCGRWTDAALPRSRRRLCRLHARAGVRRAAPDRSRPGSTRPPVASAPARGTPEDPRRRAAGVAAGPAEGQAGAQGARPGSPRARPAPAAGLAGARDGRDPDLAPRPPQPSSASCPATPSGRWTPAASDPRPTRAPRSTPGARSAGGRLPTTDGQDYSAGRRAARGTVALARHAASTRQRPGEWRNGRRAGLRSRCRKTCEFESRLAHHPRSGAALGHRLNPPRTRLAGRPRDRGRADRRRSPLRDRVPAPGASGRKVPGFRPGKAPRHLIDRYVGRAAVLAEAIDHLVTDSYDAALDQTDLIPLDQPDVEIDRGRR